MSHAPTIRLAAEDIFSKYGFGDGDLLDDLLEDNGFAPTAEIGEEDDAEFFGHAVLRAAVQAFLRPVLPPECALTFGASRCHNPVRLSPFVGDAVRERLASELRDVAVDVPVADLLGLARGVAAATGVGLSA
jgi:hypothetical protein